MAEPWILAATVIGSAMAFIDGTVVNVALPEIQARLGATAVDAQWIVESYALFLAALILVGGSMGDHYGHRRIFALGIVLFAVASVWCGISRSPEELIIARAVQGSAAPCSSRVLWPSSAPPSRRNGAAKPSAPGRGSPGTRRPSGRCLADTRSRTSPGGRRGLRLDRISEQRLRRSAGARGDHASLRRACGGGRIFLDIRPGRPVVELGSGRRDAGGREHVEDVGGAEGRRLHEDEETLASQDIAASRPITARRTAPTTNAPSAPRPVQKAVFPRACASASSERWLTIKRRSTSAREGR